MIGHVLILKTLGFPKVNLDLQTVSEDSDEEARPPVEQGLLSGS